MGLTTQLAPAATFELPEELDPGSEELAGTTFRNPNGTYFHYLNRAMRQFASSIIAAELANGSNVNSRLVLTKIPAGGGAGIDEAAIKIQIMTTYSFLTGISLAADSADMTNLLAIFQAGGGAASDALSRDAWRAVLIAILLSPDFVTY